MNSKILWQHLRSWWLLLLPNFNFHFDDDLSPGESLKANIWDRQDTSVLSTHWALLSIVKKTPASHLRQLSYLFGWLHNNVFYWTRRAASTNQKVARARKSYRHVNLDNLKKVFTPHLPHTTTITETPLLTSYNSINILPLFELEDERKCVDDETLDKRRRQQENIILSVTPSNQMQWPDMTSY